MQPAPGRSSVDRIEETLIGGILGVMTLITFSNVIARYILNANIFWALESTVLLFGWMVLLGASYAVKKSAHLGVDATIEMVGPTLRQVMALLAVAVCIAYAFLLLKGSWDYWANFANLPQTTGRWFPTGFEESFRPQAWYEVNDIPNPPFLKFLEDAMNDGDEYEKLPRFVPYAVLPFSMALLLFRFLQAAIAIWRGARDRMVASHEVEDELAEVRERRGEG
ncbi:2,3-diketo-L-gulonate TRAP transporter small permease protein YiaM (plasmid) [Roseovarius sp. THAF8]|uniref:TRAP transporter small permease n=1 Tax=Roseovarius sp. THAF8 TaxID=2587846 RepID=UPI001268DFF0|nr:TRAP transporter small permease [Roseovarius sp. THAF8]QFT99844.1 2,3-diketo-L-gulonate TRAP transporter small permease protein YiaM [Roseovarius sp. THAF8]